MNLISSFVQAGGIWDAASKIVSFWNLAAFALAIVLYIVVKTRQKQIPLAVWIVIVLLVAIPISAWVYTQVFTQATRTSAIYRVRTTVVDPQGIPVEDAKVWSSFGGEPKRVAGGWQFDIPAASKPTDGILSIFASKDSAFLTGQTQLVLNNDFTPAATINLSRDTSARVLGQVVDEQSRAITGARVFVVGYESEGVLTKEGGNFDLPAHAAINQEVLLHAEKPNYSPAKLWHPAGDTPAVLVLER